MLANINISLQVVWYGIREKFSLDIVSFFNRKIKENIVTEDIY